jgi:hypothetical protein
VPVASGSKFESPFNAGAVPSDKGKAPMPGDQAGHKNS